MFSDRSKPNLGALPSLRFSITSARRTRGILLAALALCVAICTSTPAHGSSSKASADTANNHQTVHYGTVVSDDHATLPGVHPDLSGAHPDLTLTYKKVRPGVTYELTNLVLYNDKCQEITAGTWYLDSAAPAYGKVTQGYTHGRLANGACPGFTFKSRAIYYTWTHDKQAKKDHFKSYWAGAGHETEPITFDFDLDY